MSPTKVPHKPAKNVPTNGKTSAGFSPEEKAAMRERAKELKANANREEAEKAVLARISEMRGSDHALAERVHAIVKANAPDLSPRLWYGMPAYARDSDIICFFQDAAKFKARYATLGFSDKAHLDEGSLWPTSFALKELAPAVEETIAALVRKAAG